MNRKQKIDAIYKKIADKTLSFGCKVLLWGNVKTLINYDGGVYPYSQYTLLGVDNLSILHEGHIDEIIGHPVMIGDVMDFIGNNLVSKTFSNPESEEEADQLNSLIQDFINRKTGEIMKLWNFKKNPIENQSDECVDFVFDLIS